MIVKRNKVNVTRICGHFFVPGNNHVPDHLVDRLLNDRQFQHELKMGTMTILGSKSMATETDVVIESSGPEPGPEMSVKEMIAVVKSTYDPATLDHFESVDNRKTVQQAIARQRKLIEPPPPKSKAKETDQTEETETESPE